MNKVFCIGYQKTATSSLHFALKEIGYNVCGTRSDLLEVLKNKRWEQIWSEVDKYDAFEDHPWPNIYKELDQKYPNSKFILTLRDEEKWINSCVKFFGEKPHPLNDWMYGVSFPKGNEDIYLKIFQRHNREVVEYFKDRPEDLLVMDITKGDGWEKLCPFLGVEGREGSFYHVNKTDDPYNWYKKSKTVAVILKWMPWLVTIKKKIFGDSNYAKN